MMSATTSATTGRRYGLERVCRTWERSRSALYARRARAPGRKRGDGPVRRGPTPALSDAQLLAAIRTDLARSPFQGEGHRKVPRAAADSRRGPRVSHPQSRGSDHQSGVCGALGGQDICSSDAPAQRVVANRLHLPAGCRVGLVLPVDRARRLLTLHLGVDAPDVDAGVGRDRDARLGPGPGRGGPCAGRPSAPAAS